MTTRWSVGSFWHRWDPHPHAPGTLRNDQFKGDWDAYIRAIEAADPAPLALGITDYFCLGAYKVVRKRIAQGALKNVPLVFPNVELRLTIETKKRQGINLHLLVCPDDEDHITRTEEALGRLIWEYKQIFYHCTEDSLRRLGRAHRGDQKLAEHIALSEGANQFKVELSKVRDLFQDAWVRENILVAVAAGEDGLSGISEDASFHAQREELGRFAHIVFSGNPADRRYWLGAGAGPGQSGQAPKPCLHGSDAHSLDAVLEPHLGRRCWIRAAATFDGLRQALVEPERRVHIGEAPPVGAGDVIRAIRIRSAPWLKRHELKLNDGLVTIIGAKGSGKTALADLVALGAGADEEEPGPASFMAKARHLVDGVEVELEWADGARETRRVGDPSDGLTSRARYLSQQFVERLCSPGALGEPLVEEIERVVFEAIPEEDRFECTNFDDLRALRVQEHIADANSHRESIRTRTADIAREHALQRSLGTLKAKQQTAERERAALEKELSSIPLKVDPNKLRALQKTQDALQKAKASAAAAERKSKEAADLRAELNRLMRSSNDQIDGLKARFATLADAPWWDSVCFSLPPTADVALRELESDARAEGAHWRQFGAASPPADRSEATGITALTERAGQLTKDLGTNQAQVARRADVDKRLQMARQAEDKAKRDVVNAERTPLRLRDARKARLLAYEAVFRALGAEEQALWDLYSPLQRRISADAQLSKLSFSVKRVVDLESWAARGEALLDLRKPPFQRRGQLAEVARTTLLPAWRDGAPSAVREAMAEFVDKHRGEVVDGLAQGATPLHFGEWLFSTDHVRVRYAIQYEGVDITNLSPGTRGVVLLALYLGLDEFDRRPLIIDQPEENLDPRSVFAELTPYFRAAAQRRQVIMVTHNANLVVNTDSDQVIVAEAQRTSSTGLPTVSYHAGGLEERSIREEICTLLEGGEDAFKKRGRRYGVATREG